MDLSECEWIKKKYEPIRGFEFEIKGQDSFEFLGFILLVCEEMYN